MICRTCSDVSREVYVRNDEDVVTRVRACRCGRFTTLEITEDRWKTLLSITGGLYGAIKRLRAPGGLEDQTEPQARQEDGLEDAIR